mgnify:CR=1 FL=1|jgi:hypothetical protein|tara:strand:- start:2741 stop:3250 length:510 start_codon:yes stop_codon:yes gene_type:complete
MKAHLINSVLRTWVVMLFAVTLAALSTISSASELNFQFGNPAFSKQGYSSHVLSIEQLNYSRKRDVDKDQKSADASAQREIDNTTINKFIKNVESRIYANLSKQLVDNMFGTNCINTSEITCETSGTALVEGATIYWVRDDTTETISLTVTDETGNVTTITVPIGDFLF